MMWLMVTLMVVIIILLAVVAAILNYGFTQVSQFISVSVRDNREALEGVKDEIRDIDRRIERITKGADNIHY